MQDLISREAAIQAAECIVDHHAITPYQTMRSAMDHLQRILRGMPSAQPKRSKGKWIDEGRYADFFPHHAYRCSECGHHLLEIEVIYDFCPFCGADMREDTDNGTD